MSNYLTAKKAVQASLLFLTEAEIMPMPMNDGFFVMCHFSEGSPCVMTTARSDKARIFKNLNNAVLAINILRGSSGEVRFLKCAF